MLQAGKIQSLTISEDVTNFGLTTGDDDDLPTQSYLHFYPVGGS